MSFFNKKIGLYNLYYENILFFHLKNDLFFHKPLHLKEYTSCTLIYPIFYKQISFFKCSGNILHRRKMKSKYSLNQSIIVEGFISKNKFCLSIPVFSFVDYLTVY